MVEKVVPTGAGGEPPAAFSNRLQIVRFIPPRTQPSGDGLGYLHSCIDKRFISRSYAVTK